jgi:hypothetical protein
MTLIIAIISFTRDLSVIKVMLDLMFRNSYDIWSLVELMLSENEK